jgi:RNA polymerase sigma factor (sigma-70 family)
MMTHGMLSPSPVTQDGSSASPLDGLTDRQLLERFVKNCDETAFETLVKRYGPMVLGVCRRVLGNADEADDAFQATFLVLVRRASTIEMPDLLGNWLYGVANRIARKARAQLAKRSQQKTPMTAMSSTDPLLEAALRELQAQLDEELEKLPVKYRAPLVLCYLEGLSNREAAQRLGWPVGSISHRLARGRDLLRRRLQDRYPNASYLVLGALPIWAVASSDALSTLTELVVRLGMDQARDGATTSVISPSVQAMTRSVQTLTDATLQGSVVARSSRTTLIALAALAALTVAALTGWSASGGVPWAPSTTATPSSSCHPATAPSAEP